MFLKPSSKVRLRARRDFYFLKEVDVFLWSFLAHRDFETCYHLNKFVKENMKPIPIKKIPILIKKAIHIRILIAQLHTCGGCGIHSHEFVASIMFVLKHFGKNFLHLYTTHSFHQTLKCSNKIVFLMYPDPADVSRFVKLCTLVHYEI